MVFLCLFCFSGFFVFFFQRENKIALGTRSQDPQCLKQQSQHFLGFMVFAFTMPAGILFASCSAAAAPAEGSGDSGFITLLDSADGNWSSINYYPLSLLWCWGGLLPPHPSTPALGALPSPSMGSHPWHWAFCCSAEALLGNEASKAVSLVGCSTQLFSDTATIGDPGQAGKLGPAGRMLRHGFDLLQDPGIFKGGDCSSLAYTQTGSDPYCWAMPGKSKGLNFYRGTSSSPFILSVVLPQVPVVP